MDEDFAAAQTNFVRDQQAWELANRGRYGGSMQLDNPVAGNFIGTDPAAARLASSGLMPGGIARRSMYNPTPVSVQFQTEGQGGRSTDWKVRISTAPNFNWYSMGIMRPLSSTNGVVFPYTPEITVSYVTNYSMQRFTHSNYAQPIYENSDIATIQISGDFTAQTKKEADYILACIYFFRSVTKMFFGSDTTVAQAGNPPPLVYLNGYGEHIFKDTPCLVTQSNHSMPSDVDYIETAGTGTMESTNNFVDITPPASGRSTRIPTVTKLTINLQPVYSKRRVSEFNLEDFAQGKLIGKGFI